MPNYLLPDGRTISPGVSFVLNDLTFPPSWLSRASEQMLADHGISVIPDEVIEPTPPTLEEVQALKDRMAWAEAERRMEVSVVSVDTSAGTHQYSLGRESRENVIGINLEITAEKDGRLPSGTVPNPRPWTPVNSPPVLLTHDDLAVLGSALRQAKESFLQAYFTHKSAIYSETDISALRDYDVTLGWPQ